jgi:hypothetical protein
VRKGSLQSRHFAKLPMVQRSRIPADLFSTSADVS